jgi:hypothetical protein
VENASCQISRAAWADPNMNIAYIDFDDRRYLWSDLRSSHDHLRKTRRRLRSFVAPPVDLARPHSNPARHMRHYCPGSEGFGQDLALLLIAPAPPALRTSNEFNP